MHIVTSISMFTYFFLSHILWTNFPKTSKKATSYVDFVRDFRILIGSLVHQVRTSAAQSSVSRLKRYDCDTWHLQACYIKFDKYKRLLSVLTLNFHNWIYLNNLLRLLFENHKYVKYYKRVLTFSNLVLAT